MESQKRKISETTLNTSLGRVDHSGQLSGRMQQLFMSEIYSDVIFTVEEQRVPAHKYILAAGNKYFQGLLYGGLSESSQKEIELNVPLEAFKAVLRYIYCGQLCLLDLDEKTVLDIMVLGNMYGFRELEFAVIEYLKQVLTLDNVLVFFKIALHYHLECLKEVCHAFMDRSASGLLVHASFKELPKEVLLQVLVRSSFLAPEFEIFSAVRDWNNHNPGVDVDPVLSCVRLCLMSDNELSKVRKSGLVTMEALMDAVGERGASRKLPHRVLSGENMAALKYGAKVIKGLWVTVPPPQGDIFPYELEASSASTPAAIKNIPHEGIVVELGITCIINHVEMRLSGPEIFSYFLEISANQSHWERVVEYKNYHCQNLQSLYFPPKPVKYLKVVGTRDNGLSIVALKATYTEIMPKQVNGFLAATVEICATGEGGEKVPLLIFSTCSSYLKQIQLDQPYFIGKLRFFLSGNSNSLYNFDVKTSTDGQDWCFAAAITNNKSSWQNITFAPRPIVFIKITSNRNFKNLTHYINLTK